MDMSKTKFKKSIVCVRPTQRVINSYDLSLSDIPDIDLYLDQVLSLMYEGKRTVDEEHVLMTKSMVHNYRKNGLIKPPNGKKYDREHFIQLLIIDMLKDNLSLANIKSLFEDVYKNEDFDTATLESAYQTGLALRFRAIESLPAYIDELLTGLLPDTGDGEMADADRISMLLCLSSLIDQLKIYARMLSGEDI